MEIVMNAQSEQAISTLEALWTLIKGQKKSVRKALAERLNESLKTENSPKVKMSEEEFYVMLEESIKSTETGPVFTKGQNESGEDFINRLLSGQADSCTR